MKFRKKPMMIDAVPFEPDPKFAEWGRKGYQNHRVGYGPNYVEYLITECGIRTASGFVKLEKGDWICSQTINGKCDVWPVKPDIFDATYEAIEEVPA